MNPSTRWFRETSKQGPKEVQKEPCANRNEPQAWGGRVEGQNRAQKRSKKNPVQKTACNDPQAWRGRVEGQNRAQKRSKKNPVQKTAMTPKHGVVVWKVGTGPKRGSKGTPKEAQKKVNEPQT